MRATPSWLPTWRAWGREATVRHLYYGEASFARSILAGVRAAREADPSLSSRFAVFGHSEGGHGAISVEKHVGETPELSLVGVIAAAPYTSVADTATLSNERAGRERDPATAASYRVTARFQVMLMTTGLMAQQPHFDPHSVMGDDLASRLGQFRNSCSVPSIAVIAGAMKTGGAAYVGMKPGWATVPQMSAFLHANDPAVSPGFTLHVPTLIVQGSDDPLVPEPLNTRFARSLQAKGASLPYKVYPGADHFTVIRRANADALAFLASRFRPVGARAVP